MAPTAPAKSPHSTELTWYEVPDRITHASTPSSRLYKIMPIDISTRSRFVDLLSNSILICLPAACFLHAKTPAGPFILSESGSAVLACCFRFSLPGSASHAEVLHPLCAPAQESSPPDAKRFCRQQALPESAAAPESSSQSGNLPDTQ